MTVPVVQRGPRSQGQATPRSRPSFSGIRLLGAVAVGLFKLAAYKNEYEVARLMTDPEALAEARRVGGPGAKAAWRLHPPALRALGMNRKISVGTWAAPAVRLLARATPPTATT